MAASGIAEHNEARRKIQVLRRAAYQESLKQSAYSDKVSQNEAELRRSGTSRPQQMSTYDQQVMASMGYNNDDMQGRRLQRRDQDYDYSAKIPNRYNNTDYTSQW